MRRNRRSIRLKGYDYSQAGAYFITICVQNRERLFGHIVDGQIILNDKGMMIQTVWNEISSHYPGIQTDEHVIMPNHIHGIIVIVGAGPCACPETKEPQGDGQPRGDIGQPRGDIGQPRGDIGQPRGVAPTLSLPDIVHRFKTMTTKRYADGVRNCGWRRFPGKLWQRNYYEHIIRNANELNRIREYITGNPAQWELDRENPEIPYRGTACPAPEWEGRK